MTLKDLLVVKAPLKTLSEKHFINFTVSRNLAWLIKAVNAECDFLAAETDKLVDTYAEKDEQGNPITLKDGSIKLKDMEAKMAFDREYANLLLVDVSDKIKKVTISEADFKSSDDLLTPLEMAMLDSLIDWVD